MRYLISLLILCCSFSLHAQKMTPKEQAFLSYAKYRKQAASVQDPIKQKAIESFRTFYAKKGYRTHEINKTKKAALYALTHIDASGRFTDLIKQEDKLLTAGAFAKSTKYNEEINSYMTEVWARLWKIADAYKNKKLFIGTNISPIYLKSILYYTQLELQRPQISERFHSSCFMLPTAAVNMYFDMLPLMEKVEEGKSTDQLLMAVHDALMVIGLQAFSQPYRDDDTQNNLVSVERFRNHVWWVGGNAIGFRSLLPVAAMYRSIPMVDVLSTVFKSALSMTTPTTNSQTFWIEGITADGCGYGHGRQCLIWGYPISAILSATSNLSFLKGSPWAKQLDDGNKLTVLSYLRGASFHSVNGYRIPCLGRGSMMYKQEPSEIDYAPIVRTMLKDWQDSFTPQEISELKLLEKNMANKKIVMKGQPDGRYQGTRFFWANDNFAKKTTDFDIFVSMASIRVDGIESYPDKADGWNFNTCDGMTLFQREGNEYMQIFGMWNPLAAPGTTSRMGLDKLTPVKNWRGYVSKENFCGGVADGREYGVAGYLFDKMNASDKKGTNDHGDNHGKNTILYGIRAHKAYFMLPDYMVALGAGITDRNPSAFDAEVHTTIDQTDWKHHVYTVDKEGHKQEINQGTHKWGTVEWVWQKGQFAYTVLPQYRDEAVIMLKKDKQDYCKMNPTNKDIRDILPANGQKLQLWINHGKAPKDASYGYAVYTGDDLPSAKLPFQVLRNDSIVQAIQSENTVEAVFYQPDTQLTIGGHIIKVSHSCVMMLRQEIGGKTKIYLNDPTQNNELDAIVVEIDGTSYNVKLPHDAHCGDIATDVIGQLFM